MRTLWSIVLRSRRCVGRPVSAFSLLTHPRRHAPRSAPGPAHVACALNLTWTATVGTVCCDLGGAALLPNGAVLYAGGAVAPSNSFLYNASTNSWRAVGAPHAPEARTSAVLVVLLGAGGGDALAIGGFSNSVRATNLVERFSLRNETWRATGWLAVERAGHSATALLDGRVLVAGGAVSPTDASVEVYDPVAETWRAVASMTSGRTNHAAVLLPSGRVLMLCGRTNTSELYDPVANRWRNVTAPPVAADRQWVGRGAVVLADGRVLLSGGRRSADAAAPVLADVHIYNPATDAWVAAAPLQRPRLRHSATLLPDHRVLVTGVSQPEVYDPATDRWEDAGQQEVPGTRSTALILPTRQVLDINENAQALVTNLLPPPVRGVRQARVCLLRSRTRVCVRGLRMFAWCNDVFAQPPTSAPTPAPSAASAAARPAYVCLLVGVLLVVLYATPHAW